VADLPFPWLIDVERAVRHALDSPPGQAGQMSYSEEEREIAFNDATNDIRTRIAQIDRHYQSEFSDVAVAAGAQEVALPTRLRFVRKAKRLVGGRPVENLFVATGEDFGNDEPWVSALYRPDKNTLYFTTPAASAFTLRVYHGTWSVPLLNTRIVVAGGSTAQLQPHEPFEDDVFVGLSVMACKQGVPNQERTVTDYDGATKTITVGSAWSVVPDKTFKLTSRPDLPWDAREPFKYAVAARLYEKNDERQAQKFFGLRDESIRQMVSALVAADRQAPLTTLDLAGFNAFQDPARLYGW
jgi:hypothetical protein